MKKILIMLIAALCMLSCKEGPMGPQGPQGPKGDPGESTNWKIIDIQINSNQWSLTDFPNNNYYYGTIEIPELTQSIYDNGLVTCYVEANTGTANAYQMPLPQVMHKEEYEGAQQLLFTETVDYSYGIGFIEIAVTFSDFFTEVRPSDMHFRLVLQW